MTDKDIKIKNLIRQVWRKSFLSFKKIIGWVDKRAPNLFCTHQLNTVFIVRYHLYNGVLYAICDTVSLLSYLKVVRIHLENISRPFFFIVHIIYARVNLS